MLSGNKIFPIYVKKEIDMDFKNANSQIIQEIKDSGPILCTILIMIVLSCLILFGLIFVGWTCAELFRYLDCFMNAIFAAGLTSILFVLESLLITVISRYLFILGNS